MQIQVLSVGKVKEPFFRQACAEYEKRLSRYTKLNCIEVADESIPEKAGPAECRRVLQREGERLRAHCKPGLTIALCIQGRTMDSPSFAGLLRQAEQSGVSCVQFLIGGSLGLDASVVQQADIKLSFSPMTFPHNLAKVMLLEQIYRGMKINRGETYHK